MKERIPETVGDKPDWLFHHYCRQYSRLDLLNLVPFNNQSYMLDVRKLAASHNCGHVRGFNQGGSTGFSGRTAS